MLNAFSQPDSDRATCTSTEVQLVPATAIDAALCDLIQRITNFSDDDFDSEWFDLSDAEVEGLVVQLVQELTNTLDGKQLSGYLLTLRTAIGSGLSAEDA